MSKPAKHLYVFGPFRLEAENGLLLRNGAPVPLKPKVSDTLLVLVRQHGRVVSKEALMQQIWGETAVEENNLTQNISVLRKTLGESATGQKYIETITKRGYRFTATVNEIFEEEDELVVERHRRARLVIGQEKEEAIATEPIAMPQTGITTRRVPLIIQSGARRKIAAAGLLAVVIVAAVSWMKLRHKEKDWRGELRPVTVAGLKSDRSQGLVSGKLSPDGHVVVYSATGDGINLFITQVENDHPVQITTGRFNDISPIWSPDSREVAFISDRGAELGIWKVPFLGGQITHLASLETRTTILKNGQAALLGWFDNPPTIYYERDHNLFALDLNSATATRVTDFDPAKITPEQFCISADQKHIAYIDQQDGQRDLWVKPMQGGEAIRLTHDSAEERRPLWLPDNQRLVYSAELDGRFRIYMARLDGRDPELIYLTEGNGDVWDVSRNGSEILYYSRQNESDIWALDSTTGEEAAITADIGMEFWPEVSSTARLVFHSIQHGRIAWDPRRSALLTGPCGRGQVYTEIQDSGFEPQWSPDGERLAFLRMSGSEISLWTIDASGGKPKQIAEKVTYAGQTMGPPYNRYQTRDYCWSADGNWIAYSSRKDGASNLWLVSADGSSEKRVTNNVDTDVQVSCPIWSRDGLRLAFVTNTSEEPAEGKQSWDLCVADTPGIRKIYHTESVLRLVGWSAANEVIVAQVENASFNRALPADVELYGITVEGGTRRHLAGIKAAAFANIHLSPNGKSIAFAASADGRDNIWILPVDGGQARKVTSNNDARLFVSSLGWAPDSKMIYYGRQFSWCFLTIIHNLE